jgi:hypothetical protein
MNELLESVVEAHGGLRRWNQFNTVNARIVTGGGLWALKGLIQDPTPRQMRVSLHDQFASVAPFGQSDWRTHFRAGRVAIETIAGEVVKERMDPRDSFSGHAMNTPWDPLHRAYFNGYAMWTYLTTPFFMAMPGFEVSEIDPLEEADEQWRGLRVKFPRHIASHSDEQDFYFGDDFLLRRHDYRVDVAGSFPAAQYVDGMIDVQGLKMPTRRRAYVRGPDSRPVRDLLMVAIDLSATSSHEPAAKPTPREHGGNATATGTHDLRASESQLADGGASPYPRTTDRSVRAASRTADGQAASASTGSAPCNPSCGRVNQAASSQLSKTSESSAMTAATSGRNHIAARSNWNSGSQVVPRCSKLATSRATIHRASRDSGCSRRRRSMKATWSPLAMPPDRR